MKEFASDWSVHILDELAEQVDYGFTASAKDCGDGPKFLRITDIQDGLVDWSDVPVCECKPDEKRKYYLRRGDIVFARTGATTGKSYLITDCPNDTVFASYLIRVRPNYRVLPPYLAYFFLTSDYWGQVNRSSSGSAQPGVNATKLKILSVPLPPLPEQKRIVAILDEVFAGITQAVSNAEKNLANARELFESYLNRVFTKKGEGWVEKSLGDQTMLQIIDGDRGKNYPKKSDFLNSGHCLFLNTKNVRPNGFNFDATMFITKEKDAMLRKGKLQRRDVLLTTRGTIGNIAIYDDNVGFDNIRINSGMLIFRPNESIITSEFLFEMLRSSIIKEQINRFTSGAAQPQLPIKTLVKFTLPVPKSINAQGEIVSRLNTLLQKTEHLEIIYQEKLTSLSELKQSILQKAFTGELTADFIQQRVEA